MIDMASLIGIDIAGTITNGLVQGAEIVGGVGTAAAVTMGVVKGAKKLVKHGLGKNIDANPLNDHSAFDDAEYSREMRKNGYEKDENGDWVKKEYKPIETKEDDFPF